MKSGSQSMVDVDRVGAVGMNSDLRKASGRCSVGSTQGFAFCKLQPDSASGILFTLFTNSHQSVRERNLKWSSSSSCCWCIEAL